MRLDDNQQKAVDSNSKKLTIVAAAGSGKTRTMIARIARLLDDGVPGSRILPITFTRKAARELSERIKANVGQTLKAFTIHSAAYNLILNEFAPRIGYRRPISIYDPYLSADVYADIIISLGIRPELIREWKPKQIFRIVNDLEKKDEDNWIRVDEAYQNRLKAYNAVDYNLMIRLAVKVLKEHEFARQFLHNAYHHILIDEFQDTDLYQMQMIKLINPKYLCVVGDADQSIYSWRGARPKNMIDIVKQSEVVHLDTNYRSCTEIIKRSNRLIANNPSEIRKKANPRWNAEEGSVNAYPSMDPVFASAEKAKNLISDGLRPEQISILCRTNRIMDEISRYLSNWGIPFRAIKREQDFWEMPMVRNVFYTLMFIQNPSDIASWSKAIDFPDKKLTSTDRAGIKRDAVLNRFTILKATAEYGGIPGTWAEIIQDLVKEFAFTEVAARKAFEKILEVMNWFEYYDGLTPGAKGNTRFKNITDRLFMQIDDLAAVGTPTLESFCEWWVGRDLQDSVDESIPAVQVSTIHGWKGLENDVIICPHWTDGKFPNVKSNTAEERRLAYVAITRARESVHIFYGGEPSYFLNELGLFETSDEGDDEDFIGIEK